MLDRVFYLLLALLPPLLIIGAGLAVRRAVLSSQTRRRVQAALTAGWMAAAGVVLWAVRQRIRGWESFDNRTFDYLFIGALAGLVVLACAIGLLGVWGRSSRGVPLCPRCWYDMSAHEGICPECGSTIRDERELVRRRSSATVVAVAVAMQLLAQFLYQYHRADHGGGQGLVPTTVLIAGAFALPREVIVSSPGFRDYSLTGRMTDNKLSDWQKTWLATRAQAVLEAGASAESVRRATVLLTRGGTESTMSLAAWKRAMRALLQDGGLGGEGTGALVGSYLDSRSDRVAPAYLRTPRDRAKAATELEEFVPAFEAALVAAAPGSDEWDDSIRLLAAAGKAERATALVVENGSFDRTQLSLIQMAYALAQLGREHPEAERALLELLEDVGTEDRFFAMVWVCRVAPESVWLQESFRALASCGEANLEVLGAAGLAGSPSTRCEGTQVLMERMAKWKPVAPVFLMTMQWPILASPDDRYASVLLDEIKRYAVEATADVRGEAVGLLQQIAQQAPSRRAEIGAFLRLLSGTTEKALADQARNAADELATRTERRNLIKIKDE